MTLPLLKVDDPTTQFNFDQIAQRFLDTGGRQVKVRFGTGTLTFTASASSAQLTVAHGLGSTPVAIFTQPIGGIAWCFIQVDTGTVDATNFKVTGHDTDGVARTGTNNFYWLALG